MFIKILLTLSLFLIIVCNYTMAMQSVGDENCQEVLETNKLFIVSLDEKSNHKNIAQDIIVVPLEENHGNDIFLDEHNKNEISFCYVNSFKNTLNEESLCEYMKFSAALCGLGAGVPYIGTSLKAGNYYGSRILGYYLTGSTFFLLGGVSAWSILGLMETCHNQKNIFYESENCKIKIGKTLGSLALGVLSSIPPVYVAYKYNSIKEMAAISFIYEGLIRSFGFYKLISGIKDIKGEVLNCIESTTELKEIKTKALEVISLSKINFINRSSSLPIMELQFFESPNEIYSYLNTSFEDNLKTQILPQYYAGGIPRKLAQCISMIFPIGGVFVNFILAYKGINILTDNTMILILLGSASVLPTFILDAYATKEVAGGIFDLVYQCKTIKDIPSSDYFGATYPKTKKIIILGSLIIASSSAAVSSYILLDNLEDTFLDSSKYFFLLLNTVTAIKFGTYGLATTFLDLGEVLLSKLKNGASYSYNCLRKLSDVSNLIQNSSFSSINSFLNGIYNNKNENKI